MNLRICLIAGLAAVLAGCGQTTPQSGVLRPGEPIPVTYYPTATRPVPTPTQTPLPTATALPVTETDTPVPISQPTPTEEGTLSTVTLATQPPTTLVPTAVPTQPPLLPLPTATPVAVVPTCPATSAVQFDLVPIDGQPYKNNALTDQNADLRLSILGLVPADAPLQLVDINGATDPNAPRLHGIFQPNRTPPIVRAYQRRDWNWDANAAPPYGSPGGANSQWPASAVDLATTPGEAILIPQRDPQIYANGVIGMVLYAAEQELTVGYARQDDVGVGYVVHLLNFCVDLNLVGLYRAQLSNGKRSSGQLPGVRSGQAVGSALGNAITVAIRDRGGFYDPRSRKDWWQGAPQP